MGLDSKVVFAGYRTEDYADVVAAMDCFTFLVPGSDGTCRALRQAAALGLPLVGTRRGAIPEIVADGENGWLVSETPEAIAAAWVRLRVDPQRRRAMGTVGRERARVRFDPARHAEWMEGFYARLRTSRADAAPGIQAGRLSSAPTRSR